MISTTIFSKRMARRHFHTLSIALAAIALSTVSLDANAEGRAGQDETVNAEFFAAMDAGQIDVKFIPRDATQANVLVKNLTDKPLHIQLPAAFAGVPIQAQGMGGMGGGGMGGGGMGGGGGGGGQAAGGGMGGGGMGGGGMGGGGMGGGGGFMRVPPERMKKMQVTTVCLEHGKPDPNPKMAYKIVPLEKFTKDENVRVLCEALGNGLVTQNTAQAAAWHMLDDLSWDFLAKKNRVESKYTGNVRWFSVFELRTAVAVVNESKRIAEERKAANPSESDYKSEG
ncbi:hypothetical protein [Stieleria marina]|uniref:Secreted protein n=1 Tax=Stieleria marina TaxID=1930275 RepID=A0A517NSM3_9BACT|nr:hypothetical protein K239x_20500 [Planctomycetes bacterium K23_9]